MPLSDFLIPFLAIALAELGDKSQILIFLLASRTRRYSHLLLGVMLGFLIVDGIAILAGAWIVDVIPAVWLKTGTGIIFILLGAWMLRMKLEEIEHEPHVMHPMFAGLSMVMMAEWGDKTQIASALFATKYDPLLVFAAVMSALFLLSISAIYLGKMIAHRVSKKMTARISGLIFIAVGILSVLYRSS